MVEFVGLGAKSRKRMMAHDVHSDVAILHVYSTPLIQCRDPEARRRLSADSLQASGCLWLYNPSVAGLAWCLLPAFQLAHYQSSKNFTDTNILKPLPQAMIPSHLP